MTRLGADTASSSDEIAQGLEKFAAIGDAFNHSDGKLPNSNLALTIQKILNSYAK